MNYNFNYQVLNKHIIKTQFARETKHPILRIYPHNCQIISTFANSMSNLLRKICSASVSLISIINFNYAPFYDNTSIAYQTLFQQASANDPYGIEQSLMRAGIGNR